MRRSRARGFKLVELLFAMALFTVGFLGVLALFTTGFSAVSHSKNLAYAAHIAQSQIEKIRFSSFSNIVSVPQNSVVRAATVNGAAVTTTFFRTLTVTSNADNSLKTVVVQIQWQERGFNGADQRTWQSLAMETTVANQQ